MHSPFETDRLILRKFMAEDAVHFFELNADPEVIQYTGDEPFDNLSDALQLINDYSHYDKYGYGRWTVLLKGSNEFLGWCGLNYNEDIHETDLGFRILKKHWNKGIATEAAKTCIDFGFDDLKLKRIIGRALTQNKASINVLKKIGMIFEKEFEAHGSTAVLYSITK